MKRNAIIVLTAVFALSAIAFGISMIVNGLAGAGVGDPYPQSRIQMRLLDTNLSSASSLPHPNLISSPMTNTMQLYIKDVHPAGWSDNAVTFSSTGLPAGHALAYVWLISSSAHTMAATISNRLQAQDPLDPSEFTLGGLTSTEFTNITTGARSISIGLALVQLEDITVNLDFQGGATNTSHALNILHPNALPMPNHTQGHALRHWSLTPGGVPIPSPQEMYDGMTLYAVWTEVPQIFLQGVHEDGGWQRLRVVPMANVTQYHLYINGNFFRFVDAHEMHTRGYVLSGDRFPELEANGTYQIEVRASYLQYGWHFTALSVPSTVSIVLDQQQLDKPSNIRIITTGGNDRVLTWDPPPSTSDYISYHISFYPDMDHPDDWRNPIVSSTNFLQIDTFPHVHGRGYLRWTIEELLASGNGIQIVAICRYGFYRQSEVFEDLVCEVDWCGGTGCLGAWCAGCEFSCCWEECPSGACVNGMTTWYWCLGEHLCASCQILFDNNRPFDLIPREQGPAAQLASPTVSYIVDTHDLTRFIRWAPVPNATGYRFYFEQWWGWESKALFYNSNGVLSDRDVYTFFCEIFNGWPGYGHEYATVFMKDGYYYMDLSRLHAAGYLGNGDIYVIALGDWEDFADSNPSEILASERIRKLPTITNIRIEDGDLAFDSVDFDELFRMWNISGHISMSFIINDVELNISLFGNPCCCTEDLNFLERLMQTSSWWGVEFRTGANTIAIRLHNDDYDHYNWCIDDKGYCECDFRFFWTTGEWSDTYTIIIRDLDTPQIDGFWQDLDTFRLSWNQVNNATHYVIYADGKEIGTTTELHFNFDATTILGIGEHKVYIRALGAGESSSYLSNSVEVEIARRATPSALTLSGNTLSWTMPNEGLITGEFTVSVGLYSRVVNARSIDLSTLPLAMGSNTITIVANSFVSADSVLFIASEVATFSHTVSTTSRTLTFDTSEEATSLSPVSRPEGTQFTLTNEPTRVSHEFLGWATEQDGTVVYKTGDEVSLSIDRTLFAVWQPYLLADDNRVNITATVYEIRHLSDLAHTSGTREFVGWGLGSDTALGQGVALVAGMVLVPVWQYYVTADGERVNLVTNVYQVSHLIDPTPKDGYSFAGWSTDGTTALSNSHVLDPGMILVPVWEPILGASEPDDFPWIQVIIAFIMLLLLLAILLVNRRKKENQQPAEATVE